MVSSITLGLLLSSAIGALAAPSVKARGHTFTIPALHNDKHIRNGTAALLKAYAKYGIKPSSPDSILNSILAKRQDGSVGADPAPTDVEYNSPVDIGGQTLMLDFDTGSADLWLFSTLLPKGDRGKHRIYDSKKSSTYKELKGYTWSIGYADGSGASGLVGTDTVKVGDTVVTGQAVELAKEVASSFSNSTLDGLLGLSFSNINTVSPKKQKTFIENAVGSLKSPLFAAYLPLQRDGEYDFGELNNKLFTGEVKFTKVDNSQGFWQYPSENYKVGDKSYSLSGQTGITDTGTTLILMGEEQVENYYAAVKGAVFDSTNFGYVFPCDSELPALSFDIGTAGQATVPGKFLNFTSISGTSNCYGGVQNSGGDMNVYGDVFLNANYGVFNTDGPKFGFAPAV